MKDTEYFKLADALFDGIEQQIDESGADIDYERHGNVLTLEFNDGSQIIINRQEPLQQIWLASRIGGYHFDYIDGRWFDQRNGLELIPLLGEHCGVYLGHPIEFGDS